jgi:phosphoenolpyruvate carboxykinase (ATP)
MLRAALERTLDAVPFRTDPAFGLSAPTDCPGVPADVLDPRAAWKDQAAYDRAAADLAGRFQTALAKFKVAT